MPANTARAAVHIVPAGSDALVKTTLAPFGVVYAAGEEWTARSESGAEIAPGRTSPRRRAGWPYADRGSGRDRDARFLPGQEARP